MNSTQELTVVEAALNEPFNLYETFDLGPNHTELKVREGVIITPKDYAKAMVMGFGMENCGAYVAGRAAACLEAMGYENSVIQLCAELKKAYTTVSNWITTIRFLDTYAIKPTLRLTCYVEIATARFDKNNEKNDQKKLELVKQAHEQQLSSPETRNLVKQERNGNASNDTKSDYPGRSSYLTITEETEFKIEKEIPAKEENKLVIELKTLRYLDWEDGEWKEIEKA